RLREGFEYDLWANREWMRYLEALGRPEPDWTILRHVLSAQEIWLRRCQGEAPTTMPQPEADENTLATLNREWLAIVDADDADRGVSYRNTKGMPFAQTMGQIAVHTIDHGTYHRGELRGLCRSRGDECFPDVGMMQFFMLQDGGR
ncbi:MAG TPA: DinB family protein, partial [Fimbriimonadaceae bacterium]|nr:DinB family protein [Fimbriimonadaceae bacterium]